MMSFWSLVRDGTTNTARDDSIDCLLVTNDECNGIVSEESVYSPNKGSSDTSVVVPEGTESMSTQDK